MRILLGLALSLLLWQNIAQADDNDWTNLAPGLSYMKLDNVSKTNPLGSLNAFRIDPNYYQLDLAFAEELQRKNTSAKQLAQSNNALIAINGGFFTPESKPLGLRIQNSKVKIPLRAISWWSVFFMQNNKPYIVAQNNYVPNKATSVAIQAGPRLMVNGRIPTLKDGLAERSAICITQQNQIILAATKNAPLSTTQLATLLKDTLQCHNALNLDGGQSTQLYAKIGTFYLYIRYFSAITDAIIVKHKAD